MDFFAYGTLPALPNLSNRCSSLCHQILNYLKYLMGLIIEAKMMALHFLFTTFPSLRGSLASPRHGNYPDASFIICCIRI